MKTTRLKIYGKDMGGNEIALALNLDDASMEINGVFFSDAAAVASMFNHPERTIRLSLHPSSTIGSPSMPVFTVVDAPPSWGPVCDNKE